MIIRYHGVSKHQNIWFLTTSINSLFGLTANKFIKTENGFIPLKALLALFQTEFTCITFLFTLKAFH